MYQDLFIVDIGNPISPVLINTIFSVQQFFDIHVQGEFAYVIDAIAGYTTNPDMNMTIINIANPTSVNLMGVVVIIKQSVSGVNGGSWWPGRIDVQGRYVYVADTISNLTIIDVSNPVSPKITSTIVVGAFPLSVRVQDTNVYIVNAGGITGFQVDNSVSIVDVSISSIPKLLVNFQAIILYPADLVIQGQYLYIVGQNSAFGSFQVFSLGGPLIQQLEAGGIETGTLTTRSNVAVGNDLDVKGGISVGSSIFVAGGATAMGGFNNVLYLKITITQSQILAMGTTTAVSILSAPGSGKIINIVNAAQLYNYVTTAFTGGGTTFLQYGNTVGGATTTLCSGGFASVTGTLNLYTVGVNSYVGTYVNAVNQNITMTNVGNANYAGGSAASTITMHIWYNIIAF